MFGYVRSANLRLNTADNFDLANNFLATKLDNLAKETTLYRERLR